MNHTPPPWKWQHHQNDAGEWTSSLNSASDDGVLFHSAYWPIRDEDARLIAAAPRLLEALLEFIPAEQEYTNDPDAPTGYRLQSARAKARAAIKAAGG